MMEAIRNSLVRPALCAVVITSFLSAVDVCDAHPQCLDFFAPFNYDQEQRPEFCTMYNDFGCCTLAKDRKIKQTYERISEEYNRLPGSPANCSRFLKEILCQECSPYSAHLYDAEATQQRLQQIWGLCGGYCAKFHQSCSPLVPLITTEETVLQASETSTEEFCQKVALTNADYCFPDVLENEDLSQWVEEAQTGTGRGQCLCLEEFANGLKNPVIAVHANDSTYRFFIGEQLGVIHVFLENRTRLEEPFLDIRDSILTSSRKGDERGLLGAAFHPNFAKNSKFYVYYSSGTSTDQIIRISEFTVMAEDKNKIDASTERVILEVDEPYANHNGGYLMFGLDGYMYASIGDGGSAGDPQDHGLNKNTLLGKIIRIDVDHPSDGRNYGIPPDNPFVGYDSQTVRYEIYAFGIRNMWRCSVDRGDRETGYGRGRLFCGDVGQKRFEEVDIIVKGGNYGWRGREGYTCYKNDQCTDEWLADEILPIHVYPHSDGRSVTGGYVYRGCQSPNLNGRYIFGDYYNGRLFYLIENNDTHAWESQEICMANSSICLGNLVNSYPQKILSFGEDEAGEVYMLATNYASTNRDGGKVFKFVDPGRRGNPSECHGKRTEDKGQPDRMSATELSTRKTSTTHLLTSSTTDEASTTEFRVNEMSTTDILTTRLSTDKTSTAELSTNPPITAKPTTEVRVDEISSSDSSTSVRAKMSAAVSLSTKMLTTESASATTEQTSTTRLPLNQLLSTTVDSTTTAGIRESTSTNKESSPNRSPAADLPTESSTQEHNGQTDIIVIAIVMGVVGCCTAIVIIAACVCLAKAKGNRRQKAGKRHRDVRINFLPARTKKEHKENMYNNPDEEYQMPLLSIDAEMD